MERYSLDLPQSVANRGHALEVGCGGRGVYLDCEFVELVITG